MKECVGTTIAAILVNGSPNDEFPMPRGLRQGDPHTPFLFVLTVEGFHVIMESMVDNNIFTGYKVGQERPVPISNLQFADNTLILGEKKLGYCQCYVRRLLSSYSYV